jgi:hypothetical protein
MQWVDITLIVLFYKTYQYITVQLRVRIRTVLPGVNSLII